MVFAVEEINHNSSLLPGVKLGYKIMDSCDHVHSSLQALFSLVSHSKTVISEVKPTDETETRSHMLRGRVNRIKGVKTEEKTRQTKMLKTVQKRGGEISSRLSHSFVNNGNYMKENVIEERVDSITQSENVPSCLADSPVPAVIGLASSSPTRAVAHTLGPFNLPLVREE